MKWLDQWLYAKVRDMWDNREKYEKDNSYVEIPKGLLMGTAKIDRSRPEGEDRITFELTSAVGGKILNVRRYDTRTESHETTTYVVPNGENLSERIVKILDLESFK